MLTIEADAGFFEGPGASGRAAVLVGPPDALAVDLAKLGFVSDVVGVAAVRASLDNNTWIASYARVVAAPTNALNLAGPSLVNAAVGEASRLRLVLAVSAEIFAEVELRAARGVLDVEAVPGVLSTRTKGALALTGPGRAVQTALASATFIPDASGPLEIFVVAKDGDADATLALDVVAKGAPRAALRVVAADGVARTHEDAALPLSACVAIDDAGLGNGLPLALTLAAPGAFSFMNAVDGAGPRVSAADASLGLAGSGPPMALEVTDGGGAVVARGTARDLAAALPRLFYSPPPDFAGVATLSAELEELRGERGRAWGGVGGYVATGFPHPQNNICAI